MEIRYIDSVGMYYFWAELICSIIMSMNLI